jgi:hypothetical protein
MTNGHATLDPKCAQIVPPAIRLCAFFGLMGVAVAETGVGA